MRENQHLRKTQQLNNASRGNPVLSVLALLTHSSFYKVLTVTGVLIMAECMDFRLHIKAQADTAGFSYPALTTLFFLTALGAVFLILCIMEGERRGYSSSYTWRRLQITPGRFFLLKTLYNILCFILLFAVQAGLGIWFCHWYNHGISPESVSPQLVFLTFYRWEFMHCMLPMAEAAKWIRNGLLILAFSMNAAVDTSSLNRRNPMIGKAVLYITTFCWFVTPIGINTADIGLCIIYVAACAIAARHSAAG